MSKCQNCNTEITDSDNYYSLSVTNWEKTVTLGVEGKVIERSKTDKAFLFCEECGERFTRHIGVTLD